MQATPTSLRIRRQTASGADPNSVWDAVHAEITRMLAEHKLAHVQVERAEEAPQQSSGGKYRAIIPLT